MTRLQTPRARPSLLRRALISHSPPQTVAADGLRALFSFVIVVTHAFFIQSPLLHVRAIPLPSFETAPWLSAPALLMRACYALLLYSVNVFMFLSAFFLARRHLPRVLAVPSSAPRERDAVATRYLRARFVRLAPLYALFSAAARAVSANPQCPAPLELTGLSLLFKRVGALCLLPSWSVSADVLLHLTLLGLCRGARDSAHLERRLAIVAVGATLLHTAVWTAMGQPFFPSDTTALDMLNGAAPPGSVLADEDRRMRRLIVDVFHVVDDVSDLPPRVDPIAAARQAHVVWYSLLYYMPPFRLPAACAGALTALHAARRSPLWRSVRRNGPACVAATVFAAAATLAGDAWFSTPERRAATRVAAAIHLAMRFTVGHACVALIMVLSDGDGGDAKNVGSMEAAGRTGQVLRSLLGNPVVRVLARASYGIFLGHFAMLGVALTAWKGWLRRAEAGPGAWDGMWGWTAWGGVGWFIGSFGVAMGAGIVEECVVTGWREWRGGVAQGKDDEKKVSCLHGKES